jgi:hypothetical protein
MNDRAREALVAAALSGHPQDTGQWHSPKGECALGVLHIEMHGSREKALRCNQLVPLNPGKSGGQHSHLKDAFDLSRAEASQIVKANDVLRWDFLTISRKIGVTDGEE